jgi:hypothetical protein
MSRKTQIRRTWGLLPLVLALMVLAVPAAAKGPVFNQPVCPPTVGKASAPPRPNLRPPCARRSVAGDRRSLNGADAGVLAGGIAVLVLVIAGGMLVVTHRRDAPARPRMS